MEWAGLLHEIGYTVSHIGFHKHGAYILENADMPGFSAKEQRHLALLVHGCRGGLSKIAAAIDGPDIVAQVLALRLAVLFHHARRPIDTPRIVLKSGRTIGFGDRQALAGGASADHAPAGQGARRMDGARPALARRPLAQMKSGLCTTLSTTAAPPSFARFDSHHTAPLRTDQ